MRKISVSDLLVIVIFGLIIYTGVGGVFNYTSELMVLFTVLVGIKAMNGKNGYYIRAKYNFFDLYLIVIFSMLLISYFNSYSRSETMPYIIRFAVYIVLYQIVFDKEKVVRIINYMFKYATVIAIVYIICYPIFGNQSGILRTYQGTGISMSIAMCIFVAYFFSHDKVSINKYICAGLIVIALMFTGKRTLFLIPAIVLVIVFMLAKDKKKYNKTGKLVLAGIVAIIGLIVTVPSARNVFVRIQEGMSDTTLSYRVYFWEYATMMWKKKPLFGWGFGTMPYHIGHAGVDLKKYSYIESYLAHNIYYEMLAEIGTIGCIIFCVFFISFLVFTIYKIIQGKNIMSTNEKFLMYLSLGWQIWFIVYGFTGNPLYMVDECWLYFIALILCNSVYFKKRKYYKIKI